MTIGILGAGSWGTTLAVLAGDAGHRVTLWARDPERARTMRHTRRNETYLPDTLLPDAVSVTSDLGEAVPDRDLLVFAVPSAAMRSVAEDCRDHALPPVVVSAAKGFEGGSLRTMSAVLREALGGGPMVAALSGPNLAREIADGQPTATVIACEDPASGAFLQKVFSSPVLRAYTSTDVQGVELAGALKNVFALATGMLHELGYGANTRAALLTRGLAEMTRLGAVLGARPETFAGLAGMGDLLATCTSPLSRNFRAGGMAARGLSPEAIRRASGQVVEGLETARAAVRLGEEHGVELPLVHEVYRVLFEGKSARDATRDLMLRPPRSEEVRA